MPNFIKDAPWYMNQNKNQPEPQKKGEEPEEIDEEAALFHQRIDRTGKDKEKSFDNWYRRGVIKDPKATSKFRKGACTNCGAVTHKVKECTERPRKVGAKFTSKNLANDEYDTSKQGVKLNFERKRDRWNGYNPDEYKKQVIEEWNLKESIIQLQVKQ
mmetsp:Transcript_14551/g.24833  ORF Transcript_14551/g.24833 Transcript_14551/m.24833 type:complete len:158 (+) Transcript_14551:101-574(+)